MKILSIGLVIVAWAALAAPAVAGAALSSIEKLLQNAAYVQALVEMGHVAPPVAGVIVRLPKVETDPAFEVRVITATEHAALFEAFLAVKRLWDWLEAQQASPEAGRLDRAG